MSHTQNSRSGSLRISRLSRPNASSFWSLAKTLPAEKSCVRMIDPEQTNNRNRLTTIDSTVVPVDQEASYFVFDISLV